MGPKGNSLRRLQEETLCRILIQGRGSMRDPKKEEELLKSSEPKYKYVEVSTLLKYHPLKMDSRVIFFRLIMWLVILYFY